MKVAEWRIAFSWCRRELAEEGSKIIVPRFHCECQVAGPQGQWLKQPVACGTWRGKCRIYAFSSVLANNRLSCLSNIDETCIQQVSSVRGKRRRALKQRAYHGHVTASAGRPCACQSLRSVTSHVRPWRDRLR